ncbi:hypothetical protein CHS0354_018680 [Potamilus streckersoni]|uniref:Uncharacterized protein n=1 Tax=Potamilus streckersoni TaxID=2493646 RepID=A0AAE0SKV7_9BIVA|nr:hypothetical protein CHS0354_018680 [Potamilus streckersoni]
MGVNVSKNQKLPQAQINVQENKQEVPVPVTYEKEDNKKKTLLTAAIDFGTTFSGYAFSWASKPMDVVTFNWDGTQVKTPSIILLNSHGEPVAFGRKAESKFRRLLQQKNTDGFYYFEKFKMQLYITTEVLKKELNKELEIEDIEGKTMKAITVFSGALKYLKKHLFKFLNQRKDNVKINSSDIHWVLTVPAIWNDGSKQFMRDAAEMAGIPNDLLTLALEPEAAAIYCILGANQYFMVPSTGSVKYILLDLGGGTADIACHELSDTGLLRELHEPTGGDFGGITVDSAFWQFLLKVFGSKLLKDFKEHNTEDYLDLFENFDRKKRTFDDSRPEESFPISPTLCQKYEDMNGRTFNESLSENPIGHLVEIRNGKLVLKSQLMKDFFEKAVSHMKLFVETLLNDSCSAGISLLVMVGGFSESKYVQNVLKGCFGERLQVIIPGNPAEAVVKGAVYFGHKPRTISRRVCRYTYGIAKMMPFNRDIHPESKRKIIGGIAYVDDLLNVHIKRGDIVEIDKDTAALSYFPPMAHVTQVILPVYASSITNPTFVDEENCRHVGNVIAELSDFACAANMELLIKLIFGGTEIRVELREKITGRVMKGKVEFWG